VGGRRLSGAGLALALLAAAALVAVGSTGAAFSSQAESTGNSVTAAPDFLPPTVEASAVGKAQGGATGFVKKGGAYFLYARIGDSGNPASGTAGVSANLSSLTASAGSVALAPGSFTAGGQSYNYRSAQLTAAMGLLEGPAPYSIATVDNAANAGSGGGSAIVDNTAPTAADVQTANTGGTAGRAEAGDGIIFSYSEPVEPESILAGWTGGPTAVVVRVTTGIALLGGLLGQSEGLQVFDAANTTLLPLGTVDLKQPYVAKTLFLLSGEMTFGATGAPSQMSISGGAVTVTLGTRAGNNALTVSTPGTMSWAPSTTPYDRAANAVSAAAVNESGAADSEF
jgi:hypothetical protein